MTSEINSPEENPVKEKSPAAPDEKKSSKDTKPTDKTKAATPDKKTDKEAPSKTKAPKEPPRQTLSPLAGDDIEFLASFRADFTQFVGEIAGKYDVDAQKIKADATYGSLSKLQLVHNVSKKSPQYYFKGDHLALIVLENGLEQLDLSLVFWIFGTPPEEATLPIAGKADQKILVYPESGTAITVQGEEKVLKVELFQACTLKEYQGSFLAKAKA